MLYVSCLSRVVYWCWYWYEALCEYMQAHRNLINVLVVNLLKFIEFGFTVSRGFQLRKSESNGTIVMESYIIFYLS